MTARPIAFIMTSEFKNLNDEDIKAGIKHIKKAIQGHEDHLCKFKAEQIKRENV